VSIAQPNASPTHGFVTVTQEMTQAGNSLQNHPTQSATTIDGWSSVLFGLPFLLIGIFIEGSALNLHPVHGKNAPSWLIAMVGSFFFLPGTFLVIHGITGLAHKMRYRREGALHPGQVWFADYHWHKEGFRFSAFGTLLGRLSFALFWSAFLVPFFWAGLRGAWPFLIGGSFFALLGLFIWYRAFQMFADLFRYGNTFLQYDNFPYFLGSTLNAQLRAPDHLADIDELTFTFRCVAERYLTGGSGRNRNSQVVCYELYKDVASFPRERLAAFAGGAIPVQFTIPADQPSTSLISTPPTYWEIEARGKGREADYEAYFLVPVYPAS
jgi:hypothetical protein